MVQDNCTTPLPYMIPCPRDGAKICKNCRYYGSVTTTDTTWYCARTIAEVDSNASCEYWKTAKQTNADRIRSMTDEELAKWFCSMCNFGDFCPYQDDCDQNGSGILKWMKEEVKDV